MSYSIITNDSQTHECEKDENEYIEGNKNGTDKKESDCEKNDDNEKKEKQKEEEECDDNIEENERDSEDSTCSEYESERDVIDDAEKDLQCKDQKEKILSLAVQKVLKVCFGFEIVNSYKS